MTSVPGYTVRWATDHAEARIPLESHRLSTHDRPRLTATVYDDHAALGFDAYWTTMRVACAREELLTVAAAINELLTLEAGLPPHEERLTGATQGR